MNAPTLTSEWATVIAAAIVATGAVTSALISRKNAAQKNAQSATQSEIGSSAKRTLIKALAWFLILSLLDLTLFLVGMWMLASRSSSTEPLTAGAASGLITGAVFVLIGCLRVRNPKDFM